MTKSTFIPTDEQKEDLFDYYTDVKDTCEVMIDEGFDKQFVKDMLKNISEML